MINNLGIEDDDFRTPSILSSIILLIIALLREFQRFYRHLLIPLDKVVPGMIVAAVY